MATGYSRSPKLLKGALVEFSDRLIGNIPNVIIFQYNPESLTRSLEVWNPAGSEQSGEGHASITAQPTDPPETFNLVLELDAADDLENPESHPVAAVSGVASRIAAMEMLLYPQEESLIGGLINSVSGTKQPVPRGTVPVVLFVWGPGRIVPVRLTSFSVEEQAFSPQLYPIRAKVTVGLKIVTPKDFPCEKNASQKIAVTAFNIMRKQKQVLAASNVANSVDSILGLLPI